MKAIETVYKGHRMRSRLEARWAVFFDLLKIKWEYEPEGFDLGTHGWYLPDFRLPDFGCWVEIKPDMILDKSVENKMSRFASDVAPILLFSGLPGTLGLGYCFDLGDSSGGEYEGDVGFTWCSVTDTITLWWNEYDRQLMRGERVLCRPDWSEWRYPCWNTTHQRDGLHFSGAIGVAGASARQARFEHGQIGAPEHWRTNG